MASQSASYSQCVGKQPRRVQFRRRPHGVQKRRNTSSSIFEAANVLVYPIAKAIGAGIRKEDKSRPATEIPETIRPLRGAGRVNGVAIRSSRRISKSGHQARRARSSRFGTRAMIQL